MRLMEHAWGTAFTYDEAMMMGRGLTGRIRAAAFAGTLGAFLAGSYFTPTRFLMKKTLLPKPGEGTVPGRTGIRFLQTVLHR